MWPIFLTIAGAALLTASLAPFLPIPHGAVKIFDFPRLQIAALALFVAIASVLVPMPTYMMAATLGAAIAALLIQLAHIAPFTPLWRSQTAPAKDTLEDSRSFTLLVSNVKQSNKEYHRLHDLIRGKRPDILVLMEVDDNWLSALRPALLSYKHVIARPQENSFGMYLASTFPIKDGEVRNLLKKEVPSIHCTVQHPRAGAFRMICLHPEPPVPNDDSIGRDAEIIVAGKLAREQNMPLLITGDLNDVAWSRSTRRFQRLSGLQDPRRGRGMFNTFDARFPLMRWPLDHIFNSPEFKLIGIERQPHIGSDHFPMLYRFRLDDRLGGQKPPPMTAGDAEEAEDIEKLEANRKKAPVGEDWEAA